MISLVTTIFFSTKKKQRDFSLQKYLSRSLLNRNFTYFDSPPPGSFTILWQDVVGSWFDLQMLV